MSVQVPEETDYHNLVKRAAASGLEQDWVLKQLATKGMIVDVFEDGQVIFTDESWEAIISTSNVLVEIERAVVPEGEIVEPLLRKARELKASALKSGLSQQEVLLHWTACAEDPAKPDQITKKRLSDFSDRVSMIATDKLDRQFAQSVYGLVFPQPSWKITAPSGISWKRIQSGWTPGSRRVSREVGTFEYEGKVYEPLANILERLDCRSASTEVEAPPDDRSGELDTSESDSATVYQGDREPESKSAETRESAEGLLTPQERYERIGSEWANKYSAEQFDFLYLDFAEGTVDLDHDILDSFEAYLCNLQALGGSAPRMVQAELVEPGTEVVTKEDSARALTLDDAHYHVKKIVGTQVGMEHLLKMFTQRVHEATVELKAENSRGLAVIRQTTEPELPRIKKGARAGEYKSKTYKGFLEADVCYRAEGGIQLPPSWQLDHWAGTQCQPLIEVLNAAAQEWLETEAPPEIKATTKIIISAKVDKKLVKQLADTYDFPNVTRSLVNETAKLYLGKNGKPWTVTTLLKDLSTAIKELQKACSDEDSEEEE